MTNQYNWTEEALALLGTDIDSAIAKRLGFPDYVVWNKRTDLGIPAYGKVPPWTEEEIALLGTMYDTKVAKKLGRTLFSVKRKRETMQIPAFKSASFWTSERIAFLGTASDEQVARQLNVSAKAVYAKRNELGIPPFMLHKNYSPPISSMDERYYILALVKSRGGLTLADLKDSVFFGVDALVDHVNALIKSEYLRAIDKVPTTLLLNKSIASFYEKHPHYYPSPLLPKVL